MFGCSFTKYEWPTWANIIGLQMPNAHKWNFGQTGGGNLFISERIIAANQKFRFNENDLVLVMWSTHCREDRYIDKGWQTPGNIFTQEYYPVEFVKKYGCVKGWLVRDLALMTMIKNTLTHSPCHSVMLKSVEPDYDRTWFMGNSDLDEVIELYRDVIYDMPSCLHDSMRVDSGQGWINGAHYHWPKLDKNKKFSDYHPNPVMYMKYLNHIGFKFSTEVENMVNDYNNQLQSFEYREQIEEWARKLYNTFPNYHHSQHLL